MEKISIDGRVVPTINGGHGSGNFGHLGRPGKVGGSASGGTHASKPDKSKKGDRGLSSDYTGKDVSLEYKAGEMHNRPAYMVTTPDDTGFGAFSELGDGRLGVKTTMSSKDVHDSIKSLFETQMAKHDSPRAKADGFLDKNLDPIVDAGVFDEYQRASQTLEDAAQMLERYIGEVQAHSTAVHAPGTSPRNIEEEMKQAGRLIDQWGKKLKSYSDMPKAALDKYERRTKTIKKSYDTIKKIAERTPEYTPSMKVGFHDVTDDFDKPQTRAMALREMQDIKKG